LEPDNSAMNPTPRNARLAIASTAVAGLSMLVAGSATTTAVAAATATSAAAGGGTGGGTPCATSSLTVRLGTSQAQGTARSTYVELDFTNISGAACTLYGYPGVSFTGRTDDATQIGAAATEMSSPAGQLVTLFRSK